MYINVILESLEQLLDWQRLAVRGEPVCRYFILEHELLTGILHNLIFWVEQNETRSLCCLQLILEEYYEGDGG